jgi:hypothetical protein
MSGFFSSHSVALVALLCFVSTVSAVDRYDLKRFFFESERSARTKINVHKHRHAAAGQNTLAAQSAKLLEIRKQVWEPNQGTWVDSGKILISYKGDKDSAYDYYYLETTTWIHDQHEQLTYTADDSVSDDYSQKWASDSGKWLDYFHEKLKYDATKGYLTEDYVKLNYQLFDPENADQYPAGLTDYEKDQFGYNNDRLITEITIQEVLSMDFALTTSKRNRYTYDANKNLTQFNLQNYVSSAWVDSLFVNYSYNEKGQSLRDSICTYRRSNKTWNPYAKRLYTYNTFDSLESITLKRYKGLAWTDTMKVMYEYYADTKLTSKILLQEWNADSAKLLFTGSDSLIYSGEDITEDIYKEYVKNAWVNTSRMIFNYETADIRPDRSKSTDRACFSMTPTAHGKIRLVLAAPSFVSVTVYDLFGNALGTAEAGRFMAAGAHTLSWDRNNNGVRPLSPGLYCNRVRINHKTFPVQVMLFK